MGFLNVDTRRAAVRDPAPVVPEGDYVVTCTSAKYVLKDAQLPLERDNLKGFSMTLAIPHKKGDGEVFKWLNLFHPGFAGEIAGQEFGVICRGLGFSTNESGYAVNADGSEVEPSDFKGKSGKAQIIVEPFYKDKTRLVNGIKAWMPYAPSEEDEEDQVESEEEDSDDVPF
jgi:hypothetical protein